MNAPLARFFAILLFAWLAVAHADQPGKTEDKGKFVTRVYRVSSAMFFPQVSEKNAQPDTKPKELRAAADGEMRYDVWNFLEANGVEKISGSEAILLKDSNALVVTGSTEMQYLVERLLEVSDCWSPAKTLEMTASLWEYEDDQLVDAKPGLPSFAALHQRAGKSLKLLASQLIATKTGQRAVVVSKQPDTARAPVAVPESKPASGTPTESATRISLNGAHGSFFEVEPIIAPDGEMVDMAISFEARLKRTDAEQDTEISVTTNLSLSSNHETIPYQSCIRDDRASAPQGKVRCLALVVGVRVVAVGPTVEERAKKRQQEDEQLIRKARAGLNAPKK